MKDDAQKLFDAVYKSPGMDFLNRKQSHQFSYNIFKGNYDELKKALKVAEMPLVLNKMMCDANRESLGKPFHMELNRYFHNYLAAAKSLIDHTRVFMNQYYVDTNFKAQFDDKIKSEFADDPLSRFIQDLRNYMLHKGLLNSSLSMSYTKIEETGQFKAESNANLKKQDLLKWDKWSKIGKQYLLTRPDEFSISSFCIEYGDKILGLYSWFEKELYNHHQKDYEALVNAQKEFEKYQMKKNT